MRKGKDREGVGGGEDRTKDGGSVWGGREGL